MDKNQSPQEHTKKQTRKKKHHTQTRNRHTPTDNTHAQENQQHTYSRRVTITNTKTRNTTGRIKMEKVKDYVARKTKKQNNTK